MHILEHQISPSHIRTSDVRNENECCGTPPTGSEWTVVCNRSVTTHHVASNIPVLCYCIIGYTEMNPKCNRTICLREKLGEGFGSVRNFLKVKQAGLMGTEPALIAHIRTKRLTLNFLGISESNRPGRSHITTLYMGSVQWPYWFE